MRERVKVFIVDDHPSIVDGLKAKFSGVESIEVIGSAGDKNSLLNSLKFSVNNIDVLVMDMNIKDTPIIPLIKTIRSDYKQIKIVAYSNYDIKSLINKAFEAGISGYVLKESGAEELINAINLAMKGISFQSDLNTNKPENSFFDRHDNFAIHGSLSQRESEVLKLIAEGKSNKEIGELLYLSWTTVSTHRRNIKKKLSAKSTADLIAAARKLGLIH